MSNLVELVKGLFGDALVERLKPFLGVDSQKANQAADAAIPALLGGLLNKLQGEGGVEGVFEFLKPFLGGKFDFGKTWSPNGGVVELLTKGHSILGSLFGDQVGEVTKSVAKAAALPDHEAGKLLKVTAPGLMGAIGSLLGEGASKSDLADLLAAQLPHLEGKLAAGMPFDFGKLTAGIGALGLGAASLGALDLKVPEVKVPEIEVPAVAEKVEEVKEATSNVSAAVAGAAVAGVAAATSGLRITVDEPEKVAAVMKPAAVKAAAPIAAVASSTASTVARGVDKGSGYLWPVLLGGTGLAGFLLYAGTRPVDVSLPEVETTKLETPVVEANVPDAPPIEVNTPEVAAPSADGSIKVEIEGGIKLDAKAGGVEYKLVDFIKSDKPVDKKSWFSFDRLYFDTAKSSLKPESKGQLNNIVAIMKAYPAVKLKIGGYTDNKGSDSFNMKLSDDRAKITMKTLVGMGVAADRLASEGFGKAFPIASNDTEDGRSKNRRIDVRVTAK